MRTVALVKMCPTSGKEYPEMYDYCTKCGIKLVKIPNRCTEMKNENCKHHDCEDEDIYCPFCGSFTTYGKELLNKINALSVDEAYIRLIPDTSEVDEALKKTERIADLMNEAMKLADSIANKDLNLRVITELDGKSAVLARITAE